MGTLKPGAEDHGLVAAVAVTVPDAMTTDVERTLRPPVLAGACPAVLVGSPMTTICRFVLDVMTIESINWPDVPTAGGT
jgi:hypothetical protein